jgi:hypothetical protein
MLKSIVLKRVLVEMGRFENAMKKRCSNTPIYFGKGE